ncbi:MAG: hypothetical protein CSA97_01060 [Bacteroidetes bacterium]|nr:MAG: hypothetical protein CSA97_01060 [Bacteroidota bacterium]
MAIEKGKFPNTTASFEKIREHEMYYVDKTAKLWQLANRSEVVFLSRPRRFGKSMLLDTIGCYLEGQKELFEGLKLYPLEESMGEKAWAKHPVLRFDFSGISALTPAAMGEMLHVRISGTLRRLGLPTQGKDAPYSIYEVMELLHEATGQRVVVLIDEYDSPILDALVKGDTALLEDIKAYLRSLYRALKSADRHLRFLMATGVSQVRQVGLFSGFNNIEDISFDPDFSTICGISEEEIHEYLPEQLAHMAAKNGLTVEELLVQLRYKYDGYRFSENEEHVYNSFGLINALKSCRLENYWSRTGTASSADKLIPRYNALGVLHLDGVLRASIDTLSRFNFEHSDPLGFLYQSGYLTIKGMDDDGDFLLDFPNKEVRESIMEILAPRTLGIAQEYEYRSRNSDLVKALKGTDIKTLEVCIQALLASLPFDHERQDREDAQKVWELREARYRDALHLIFAGVRSDVRVEQIGAGGISDVEIIGAKMIVIIELKMKRNGMTAGKALAQALGNGYPDKHSGGEKPVWAVGAVIGEKAQVEWMEECVWEGSSQER